MSLWCDEILKNAKGLSLLPLCVWLLLGVFGNIGRLCCPAGILIPLCESGTCTLREAIIIGSILTKCSIPVLHSR